VTTELHPTETVLIVDDNDIVRKLVCAFVESAGYTVLGAASSQEALEKARECESLDVVVTDVVMADGGGLALVEDLKRVYPSVRTLYMSGYPDARLTGNFIAKPFSADDLLAALRGVLDADAVPAPPTDA
jgi:DNA-binding NtrC family response regulator